MEIGELTSKARYHLELARGSADAIRSQVSIDGEYTLIARQIGCNLDVAEKLLGQAKGLQPSGQVPQLEKTLLDTRGIAHIAVQAVQRYVKPDTGAGFYRWSTWANQDEIKPGSYEHTVLSMQHRWGLL